jgi:hypothetical protein
LRWVSLACALTTLLPMAVAAAFEVPIPGRVDTNRCVARVT